MKQFKLYWLNGTETTVEGIDITFALIIAGYGGDHLPPNLDYYKEC